MTPSERNEETLLQEALQRAKGPEREAFLDGACLGNPQRRALLEALLQAEEGSLEPFVKSSAEPPDIATVVTSPQEGPGMLIGRYKLLEKVGEGGFGAVYVAEQREPVKRRVALKVIKLGMDSRQVVARFEAERQALALMDHPSIAKVLDAGATENGRPYFVMELVKGIPITQYCDREKLGIRERLLLFVQICHAIQHAHQKGIIHRDIKPSNVLVTLHDGVPVPKVIDFGIAKATQQELTDKTVYTQFQQFIGTPAYMSPEQAEMSGLDIDTRSDIYALGVLLYELLTGSTPFDTKELLESSLDHMRQIIREREPVRPSTRLRQTSSAASSSQLITRHSPLATDLDWIVMKCLEKDRRRRYETANGVALDIERHLNHEPVVARPPSTAYRARKFVRRNRGIMLAAVAVAAALVLGIVASAWEAMRAEANERRALQAQAGEARERLAAVNAKTLAEQRNYVARIGQAQAAIRLGQYGAARQILGEPDLASRRGWEWGWLERNCNLDLMTLSAHGVPVGPIAFSPDGRWLAAGAARIWDAATGAERASLPGSGGGTEGLHFSPDSRRLAAACWDSTARIWDVATGQLLLALTGHADTVYFALFSPDGRTIATGSRDRTVRLWDAATGAFLRILGDYGDTVVCGAFSPDGALLAYGGGSHGQTLVHSLDTSVRIVDLRTGNARVLTGHTEVVRAMAFHPDGNHLLTASWDGTAGMADVRTDTELRPFFKNPGQGPFIGLAVSPDGRFCAVTGSAMTPEKTQGGTYNLHLIDLQTHRELRVLAGHALTIFGVAFSPDGGRVATASFDGTVKVWPVTLIPEFTSLEGHDQAVWTVAVSPDGRYVATGSLDQTAKLWELESGRLATTLPVNFPVVSLAFSPDSSRLITTGGESTAKVWDLSSSAAGTKPSAASSDVALTLRGHSNTVTSVAYDPLGRFLATGSKDCTARVWDAHSGRLLRTLSGHTNWVLSVAFSPDGKRLATASADQTARIWGIETGRWLLELRGHAHWVLQVGWSPDARVIATGSEDRTARLWDPDTGRPLLAPLGGHNSGVSSLAFSPDSQRLATVGGGIGIGSGPDLDISVLLWDLATGQQTMAFLAHVNSVRAVAFSPDATRLVTGSADNTARVRRAFAWELDDRPGDTTSPWDDRLEAYKRQFWREHLTLNSVSGGSGRQWKQWVGGDFNLSVAGGAKRQPFGRIPERDSTAGPNQVDLAAVYNAALNEASPPTSSLDDLGQSLCSFPAGVQELGEVLFDARGIVQLSRSSPHYHPFPEQVRVPIGRAFHKLHALHGTVGKGREGTVVGHYELRYTDGQEAKLEIRYGGDLRDWQDAGDPDKARPAEERSNVAWTGPRSAVASSRDTVGLYRTTYVNPRPELQVMHLDFVSRMTQSAPFLIALTVE